MRDEEIREIERAMSKKLKKSHIDFRKEGLSSGSTLLNLASTGKTFCCFLSGHYYWFVGDSTSGKTWLALACLAEATINPNFDDYRLIYDNAEDGALMDIERYFGKKLVERIEPPAGTKEDPRFSETTEELHFNIDDAVSEGSPFIYIMDSMDSLETKEDQEHFEEAKKAHKKNKESGGSYGVSKAKVNSAYVRRIVRNTRKSKSIVIIISQTRDRIGREAKFNPKTVAGGRALKFYSTVEIWTAVKGSIKRRVRKKERKIGIISKVMLKKNRITGNDTSIEVPIYRSSGIDDVGSMVNFLIDEGHWKVYNGEVKAKDFDFVGDKESLIKHIEGENFEKKLKSLAWKVWHEIERDCKVERKNPYT